jgi:hypothetical protein
VDRDGQSEVEGGGPERVVLPPRKGAPVGELVQVDALEAEPGAALHLRERRIQPALRHERHPDQAVRRHRAVLLPEEVVVGANHGEIGCVVGDAAPGAAPADGGEQDLGVDAVHVLFLEALLRRSRARLALVLHAGRVPGFIRSARRGVVAPLVEGAILNQPGVRSVRELDQTRGPVPVLGRDAVAPAVRGDFQV